MNDERIKAIIDHDNKGGRPDHPYMGDLTSAQIGSIARAGSLGGEMVRRMIKEQEERLANEFQDQDSSLF